MTTDGPAALRLMLDKLIPINLNAEWDKVDKLVSVWQAEREQAAADRQYTCAEHKDEARRGGPCVWCQLAADRADLAAIDADLEKHAIPAEGNTVWSVHFVLEQRDADRAEIANCLENIRELTAQKRISDAVIADVREELHIGPGVSVVEEAGRVYAALAQARALLAEAEARRMTRYETNDDTDFWYRVLGWLGGAR